MEKPSTPAPTTEKQVTSRPQTSRARAAALPEVDLYIHLLVLLYLTDQNALKSVRFISIIDQCQRRTFHFQALDCARRLMDKASVLNRRTLDLLAAKCYFYYARIFELNNMLESIRPYVFSSKR